MKLQEHNHDDDKMTLPHYVRTIQYYTNTIYVQYNKKEYRVLTSKGGASTHKEGGIIKLNIHLQGCIESHGTKGL